MENPFTQTFSSKVEAKAKLKELEIENISVRRPKLYELSCGRYRIHYWVAE